MSYRNLPSQSMLRWETYARDTFIKTNFSLAALMSHFFAILEDLEFICPAWNGFHFCSRHRHKHTLNSRHKYRTRALDVNFYQSTHISESEWMYNLFVHLWPSIESERLAQNYWDRLWDKDIQCVRVNRYWWTRKHNVNYSTLAELVSLKPGTTIQTSPLNSM